MQNQQRDTTLRFYFLNECCFRSGRVERVIEFENEVTVKMFDSQSDDELRNEWNISGDYSSRDYTSAEEAIQSETKSMGKLGFLGRLSRNIVEAAKYTPDISFTEDDMKKIIENMQPEE